MSHWRWIVAIIIIAALLVVSVAVYRLFFEAPAQVGSQFDDPENDVTMNVGYTSPGLIDIVKAKLEANNTTLEIRITMKDNIPTLGSEEHARWNLTVILENEEIALVKAYEITAELNATHLVGYVTEVGTTNTTTCNAERSQNLLTLSATLDGLENAKEVEWSILAEFESFSEGNLTTSASDAAPDEGLYRTVL
jgi:hypothetical protein